MLWLGHRCQILAIERLRDPFQWSAVVGDASRDEQNRPHDALLFFVRVNHAGGRTFLL